MARKINNNNSAELINQFLEEKDFLRNTMMMKFKKLKIMLK